MEYQKDYVLRIIEQMGALMRAAFERFLAGGSTEQPLELTTEAVGLAIDMDPELFLRLAPQSMVSLLEVSGYDDRIIQRVAEALELQSEILESQGSLIEAGVRREQATALRDSIDPSKAN